MNQGYKDYRRHPTPPVQRSHSPKKTMHNQPSRTRNYPSNIHTVVVLFASQILHPAKRPLPPKFPKSFVNPFCARTLPYLTSPPLPSPAQPCPPSSSSTPTFATVAQTRCIQSPSGQFVIQPTTQKIILRKHPKSAFPSFTSFLTAPLLRLRVAFSR